MWWGTRLVVRWFGGMLLLAGGWAAASDGAGSASGTSGVPTAIVCKKSGPFAERLAAKEIRRYVYLRTGKLLPIVDGLQAAPEGGLIVVGGDGTASGTRQGTGAASGTDAYILKTVEHEGRPILVVSGGGPAGTLYAAYRLAEHLGVRFYLHGDVVPDEQVALDMPQLDEARQPLFELRGIQPFHDFPEGPDWWNTDDYKAVLGQLPKMGMNFIGLHTYPQGGVGPEPLTWIGLPGDVGEDGKVKFSYPSRHFTTGNPTGAWGYRPAKTGDYTFGAAAMYERDDYGADYMRGTYPWTEMSPRDCNALFDRVGGMLRDVFTLARRLGIKTCIGTETPLTIPTAVQERLKAAGKDTQGAAVVQEVYRGMFERIMRTHPLDYYWLWTPEGWTWGGVKQEEIEATVADLGAAMAAAEQAGAPFRLATCGWVLGPPQDRALFDTVLPKEMPMSCISRGVGHEPVEPGFAKVRGRPKWAIPWLEDDPALNSPQLWVGRMRKDAADARAYGCTGLMGIHWRTRVLGPNVSALAKAAWDQKAWNPALSQQATTTTTKPPEGPDGGQFAGFPNNPIAGTDDDPLYQTVRYNVKAYYLDLPNGTYTVTLKLCEPYYTEAGRRVFGAKVQGKTVFGRLDLFAEVGQNRAVDYTVKVVKVSDGRLVIEFPYVVEFPCIAAIVVEGPAATRKINCGGPAWQDYQADWPASTPSDKDRFLATDDFYADWAASQFGVAGSGPGAAGPIARLFAEIDCHLPRPSDWVGGPGGIRPDDRPWEEVRKQYAFVDRLAELRPSVTGAGSLERFDYWLECFRYMRANAQVNCTWARLNKAMAKVRAEKDPEVRRRLARELALPIRKELIAQVAEVHRHLLATVSTSGEMGNVTNWQQHILPGLLTAPGQELAEMLGQGLPAEAMPSQQYQGQPRLLVPTVRTGLVGGEALTLKVILLGAEPREAAVYWRPLGRGQFAKVPLEHVARGVYTVTLPAQATQADLEYYVRVEPHQGLPLHFPATAPRLNQTVVVVDP